MDLATLTAGEVYSLWKQALSTEQWALADILCDLEMAIRGDRFEDRVEIETRLLPLMLAQGIES